MTGNDEEAGEACTASHAFLHAQKVFVLNYLLSFCVNFGV